jgi:hypothetical protein
MRWVDFWDFVVIEGERIETVERVNGGECFWRFGDEFNGIPVEENTSIFPLRFTSIFQEISSNFCLIHFRVSRALPFLLIH